ncbi:hypothetical protein CLOM_g24536 [Closterium sp. NIES-68]|nr:hypothetical protein CLOM_g24536 [Closterium sp. NIES-68]
MVPELQAWAVGTAVEGAEGEEEDLAAVTSVEAVVMEDMAATTTMATGVGAVDLMANATFVTRPATSAAGGVDGFEEPATVGKVTLHSLDFWVIDSGATYSMTPRADLLTELEPSSVKHVTSALGQRAEVKGMGKAMFKGADGKMVGLKNACEPKESGAAAKGGGNEEGKPKISKAAAAKEQGESLWGTIASAAFSNPTSATGECDWLTLHRRMGHVALPILQQIVKQEMEVMLKLQDKFKCKTLGDVNYYLGLHIERDVEKRWMRVHQKKYLEALAASFGKSEGHVATPLPSGFKCVKGPAEESVGEEERRRFHSLVGSLIEVVWQRRLLAELGEEQQGPTPLYCDSQGAIALAKNPVLHGLTKHMKVKWHWVRSMVTAGEVELHYVKTTAQPADMMTKRLVEQQHWNLYS